MAGGGGERSARTAVLKPEGHQDDVIAKRAGISTTSVRRHIKAIMNQLSANSRFAAGAAAQRRGWVG